MITTKINRVHCLEQDKQDPLAFLREEFHLQEGQVNMDGNSLGSLPKQTKVRISHTIQQEWGNGLIASWAKAGWMEAPIRVGNKIAPLIGAHAGEVLVADSTSVNLYKALCAAIRINKDRSIILSEKENFPTDIYLMQGLEAFTDGRTKVKIVDPEAVLEAITEEVAVLVLTQVHYKTAHVKDMKTITEKAHQHGVLVVWDLSHSVGSIEVDVTDAKADFAVGCGYKFLNGGPGAPGFIYVAKRHQQKCMPVLAGWMGHRDPFAFSEVYEPAEDISRFRCGTPGILGMVALESGVDLFSKTSIVALRQKAIRLSNLFIELMEQECSGLGFSLCSPSNELERGGHVSFRHAEGHGIFQAIRKRNITSDFRTPDVLRFGITPMYLRYQDVYDVVIAIKDIMASGEWDRPAYKVRAAIT